MEYQSNNSALTASNGSTGSIASNPASDSKNRKPATAQQLVRENVQYLIEQLEAGKSEALTAFLDAMAHFRNYSFGNVLLIARQKPQATNVAGMWAWNQLGRRVRRGEKGIAILAPMVAKTRKDEAKNDSEDNNRPSLLGFRRVYVWDESQTEGASLPELDKVTGEAGVYLDRLREYVNAQGIMLEYNESIAPALGMAFGNTNPIYSQDRQHLLIPEGTFILGDVQKVAGLGQKRLAVTFHRLLMPDGYSVDLDQFHGLDQAGSTGLKDKVNNHYVEIFGASIALGAIAGAAEATNNNAGYNQSGTEAYKSGIASNLSQSSANVLDRFINIPPTITIREGHRIKVYITQDMLLPAYENHDMPGVM